MRLLYNMSMDTRYQAEFDKGVASAVPAIMQLGKQPFLLWYRSYLYFSFFICCSLCCALHFPAVIRCPNKIVDPELIALAVNLARSPQHIEAMCQGDGLMHLIKRVHQTFDPLLIKLIRNISQFAAPKERQMFVKHLHELVGMATATTSQAFLLEVFGTLANICLPDVMYSELIIQHGLLEFMMKHLVPGFSEDDVVLEVLMLIGTLARDPKSAIMLGNARLIRILYELLNEKAEDVEIVLQLLYTTYKLLLHEPSRLSVIAHEPFANCLLDLVVDPEPQIRILANQSLGVCDFCTKLFFIR